MSLHDRIFSECAYRLFNVLMRCITERFEFGYFCAKIACVCRYVGMTRMLHNAPKINLCVEILLNVLSATTNV